MKQVHEFTIYLKEYFVCTLLHLIFITRLLTPAPRERTGFLTTCMTCGTPGASVETGPGPANGPNPPGHQSPGPAQIPETKRRRKRR